MKKNPKLLIAGGLVAAVAASGGAFTAGINTAADASDVVANGDVDVTGATLRDIQYTHDGTGENITQVTVEFDEVFEAGTVFELWVGETKFTSADAQYIDVESDSVYDDTLVTFTGASAPIADASTTHIVVNGDIDTTPSYGV